jgi:hypothetical protein
MKTFLVVWFNSDGKNKPSDISERLLSMGFRPVEGHYDYVYEWDSNADLNEILKIGDQVQNTLKGSGALFKLETIS